MGEFFVVETTKQLSLNKLLNYIENCFNNLLIYRSLLPVFAFNQRADLIISCH